ncbi:hypothetical protein QTP88_001074 [Uroleucon formosanum]
MANINSKSTTKLRGNEPLKNHCQNRPNYDSGFQASGYFQNAFYPKQIPETKRQNYGGRGLAIQELAESMSSNAIKNSNSVYNNNELQGNNCSPGSFVINYNFLPVVYKVDHKVQNEKVEEF